MAGWCELGSRPLVRGAPAAPTFQCPLDGRPVVELQTALEALDAGRSDVEPVFCMQGTGTGNCTECQRAYCEITAEYLDYQDWQMLITGVPDTNREGLVPRVFDSLVSAYSFYTDTNRTAPGAGSSNSSSFLFSMYTSSASRVVFPDVNYTASTPASEYVADCMRSLENTTFTRPDAPELVNVVRGKDGICVEISASGFLNGSSTMGHNVSDSAVRWGTAS